MQYKARMKNLADTLVLALMTQVSAIALVLNAAIQVIALVPLQLLHLKQVVLKESSTDVILPYAAVGEKVKKR